MVHEALIGAVVDDSLSKDRCRELAVDLLRVQIRMFPIEDEIVALAAKEDCCRFAEKHKGETVSVFGPAVEEELVRVHAVLYRATNQWEQVENHWRAVWVREVDLSNHILGDNDNADKSTCNGHRNIKWKARVGQIQRLHCELKLRAAEAFGYGSLFIKILDSIISDGGRILTKGASSP